MQESRESDSRTSLPILPPSLSASTPSHILSLLRELIERSHSWFHSKITASLCPLNSLINSEASLCAMADRERSEQFPSSAENHNHIENMSNHGDEHPPRQQGPQDTSQSRVAQEATSSSFLDPLDQDESVRNWNEGRYYNWKRHFHPSKGSIKAFLKWFFLGADKETSKQTDEEIHHNLKCVARMIVLLREYYEIYGLPKLGGPRDQEFVLREVVKDLYAVSQVRQSPSLCCSWI